MRDEAKPRGFAFFYVGYDSSKKIYDNSMSNRATRKHSARVVGASQQERERQLFEQFRKDYQLPPGVIEHSDKPDVIIHSDQTLGIELTDLYLVEGQDPAGEQTQTTRRNRVVVDAQSLHTNAGGKPIELAIGFDPEYPITDEQTLARSIAEVASYVERAKPGQVDRDTFDHLPCVDFMYFSGSLDQPLWQVQQSYSVPKLQVHRVREVVATKIKKARHYQPCGAYWLVIAVDFWNPAQDQDIEWPDGECVDPGPYERVLLYKPAFRRVIEVPLA